MNEQDEVLVDLGDATEQTKGYNFDFVYEIVEMDKRYNG
jgi:hypothetical protein